LEIHCLIVKLLNRALQNRKLDICAIYKIISFRTPTPIGIRPLLFDRNYNHEKKSSGLEMRLVIVVGLLAVTVIALIVALTLQMAVFRTEEYKMMCQSEECIKTGKTTYALLFERLISNKR